MRPDYPLKRTGETGSDRESTQDLSFEENRHRDDSRTIMPCGLRDNNGPRRLQRVTERGSPGRVARQPVQSRLGRCQPDGVSDQLRARSRLGYPSNRNVPSWEQADEAAGHGARGIVHRWHLGWRPCQVTGPEAETRHGEWYSLACPG